MQKKGGWEKEQAHWEVTGHMRFEHGNVVAGLEIQGRETQKSSAS